MKRLDLNKKILSVLKGKHPEFFVIYDTIEDLINKYPQQRFGQIICNYVCSDYRDGEVSTFTNIFLNTIFPNNPDPFFEESSETLTRLC